MRAVIGSRDFALPWPCVETADCSQQRVLKVIQSRSSGPLNDSLATGAR